MSNQQNDIIVDNLLEQYDLIATKNVPEWLKKDLRDAINTLDEDLIEQVLAGIAHYMNKIEKESNDND